MSIAAPISRRMLLGRLGSGTGVIGTFLLPRWMHGAMAADTSHRHGHRRQPANPEAGASSPLVMLDPGHGGKDPGAVGISGTYEKHVALAVAFELKRQLETGGRYRVAM